MTRASALSFFVALGVLLGACGKDEPRSGVQETVASASSAPVSPAEPVREPQHKQLDADGGQERDGLATVHIAQLPRQAVATLRLIQAGGPFPFEKDGVVFGNRERLLPRHPRGYYHEYTVPTPRARDRGARRIVCGGPKKQLGDCYYSDDHYTSFKRIADQLRD
ncbi:guanine-specific ribonuclease N1 and T1 [Caballeronia fortuita]|uniref:Guanine-specific ribonuclease N1 and T1 n=1 Tax=Caballeronia fortuita TaxID=1777138 RepID=A0A158BRR2_9BURK|nr:ribonuclease [Caballeronia fortuita]SAK72798.1 guanine-specific ribonuclease N1 and T1 [Caballeronia fortuita]